MMVVVVGTQTYSVKKGKSPDKDADRQQEQKKQSGQP
jgi:hypothetical protein